MLLLGKRLEFFFRNARKKRIRAAQKLKREALGCLHDYPQRITLIEKMKQEYKGSKDTAVSEQERFQHQKELNQTLRLFIRIITETGLTEDEKQLIEPHEIELMMSLVPYDDINSFTFLLIHFFEEWKSPSVRDSIVRCVKNANDKLPEIGQLLLKHCDDPGFQMRWCFETKSIGELREILSQLSSSQLGRIYKYAKNVDDVCRQCSLSRDKVKRLVEEIRECLKKNSLERKSLTELSK